MAETKEAHRVREILAAVKPLAAEFYQLTGKPLGVTGEVAEFVAADLFGLELAPPRTAGYDAIRRSPEKTEYIQIKGRAFGGKKNPGQRLGRIKLGAECDIVLLVLLDNATLEPREVLEATYASVCDRLSRPGKAHERGALAVAEFKQIGKVIWSATSD